MLERLRESQNVAMNQFNPMMNDGGLRCGGALEFKSVDGGAERTRVELSHHRAGNVRNRPLRGALLVTDPAEFPGRAAICFEGIECVGGQQAGRTAAAT